MAKPGTPWFDNFYDGWLNADGNGVAMRIQPHVLLTACLSGHRIMINGHALSPPLSVVAAITADPEPRSSGAPAAERGRTTWTIGGH